LPVNQGGMLGPWVSTPERFVSAEDVPGVCMFVCVCVCVCVRVPDCVSPPPITSSQHILPLEAEGDRFRFSEEVLTPNLKLANESCNYVMRTDVDKLSSKVVWWVSSASN
jgi:hypothetical protein